MSSVESKSTNQDKPKRTLNPVIKAMNDYRNNVIGVHIGSKAPKKTSPDTTLDSTTHSKDSASE